MDRPARNTRLDSLKNSGDSNAASVCVEVFDSDAYSHDPAGRFPEHTLPAASAAAAVWSKHHYITLSVS